LIRIDFAKGPFRTIGNAVGITSVSITTNGTTVNNIARTGVAKVAGQAVTYIFSTHASVVFNGEREREEISSSFSLDPTTDAEYMRQLPKLVIFVGSIEALIVNLFSSTPVVEQVLAALLLAAPETNPVLRCAAFRFDTPALLSILIEVDDLHRLLPQGDLHGSAGYKSFYFQTKRFREAALRPDTLAPPDKHLTYRVK
jgi:hypothetical protein